MDVNGNAETIYYPMDDKDSTLVGINKTQSSFVVMHLKNKKVQRIVMTSASNGNMYPLTQLSGSELYLKNYFWIPKQRPIKREDIFLKFPKTVRVKLGNSNLDSKNDKNDVFKPAISKVLPTKNKQEIKSKTPTSKGLE